MVVAGGHPARELVAALEQGPSEPGVGLEVTGGLPSGVPPTLLAAGVLVVLIVFSAMVSFVVQWVHICWC